jgi:hypothetical protein
MPKSPRTYIKNQYNYNCCQSSKNTQSSDTNWHLNKQSVYWLYFEHIRHKIHKAETQFQLTGSTDYWNKVKALQHIQYQLVENSVNLQEETAEELIPKYTVIIKEEPAQNHLINGNYPEEEKEIKKEPTTETTIKPVEVIDSNSEDSDSEHIPSNQQEDEEDELVTDDELINTYLYSQPQPQTPLSP